MPCASWCLYFLTLVKAGDSTLILNSLCRGQTSLVSVPKGAITTDAILQAGVNFDLVLVHCPPFSTSPLVPMQPRVLVELKESADGFLLTNGVLTASLSAQGLLTSLTWVCPDGDLFEAVKYQSAIGELHVYDDVPLFWDGERS